MTCHPGHRDARKEKSRNRNLWRVGPFELVSLPERSPFDVSVLDQFESALEIRSSAGEIFPGGEDFTRSIARHILLARKMNFEQVETRHPLLISRLIHECEAAKRELSRAETAIVRLPQKDGTIDQSCEHVTITLADLKQWTENLLTRTRAPLQRALADAGVTRQQIDEVIFVGARLPGVSLLSIATASGILLTGISLYFALRRSHRRQLELTEFHGPDAEPEVVAPDELFPAQTTMSLSAALTICWSISQRL